MATKDFSAPPGGRRLRVSLDVYTPHNRQFRHVKGVGARITVQNKDEERRLWRAIEKTIAAGEWRRPDAESPAGTDLDAAGAVADRPASP